MPTERPDLPSLDEALATGIPDNATFPITETPPPGYMTDENEPVSPSSSAGNISGSHSISFFKIEFKIKRFKQHKFFKFNICFQV